MKPIKDLDPKLLTVTWELMSTASPATRKHTAEVPCLLGHRSFIFVCPQCGEPWGKIIIEGRKFKSIDRYCEDHGDGTLLLDYFSAFAPMIVTGKQK